MIKKAVLSIALACIAVSGFAQMDMLPQLFRDLPPELQEGIPESMTYEEYRQLNRNIDFFTMFMSMFVPGYGLFQVEKPGLAAGVVAGRTAGYGLMAAGIIRQWDSLQDLGNAAELSVGDFNQLVTNAALFGSGIILNGLGWALDVIGAYHIAKKEKDFVIYKYGLQKEIGGGGELQLISYIRKLKLQPDDRQVLEDLEYSLKRFVEQYPFSEYAPEAEYYLSVLYQTHNEPAEAMLHAGRSVFLYPGNSYIPTVRKLGAGIVQRNSGRWDEDSILLMRLADINPAGTDEERYFRFVRTLGGLDHTDFKHLFPKEAQRFFTLFPESRHSAELHYLLAEHFAGSQEWETAVIEYIRCAALYPDSDYAAEALFRGAYIIEAELKRPAYATSYYRRILELYPGKPAAAEAEKKLKGMNQQ